MSITPITGDMPTVITPTEGDYASITLPIDITCPNGNAAVITALRGTCQLPEAIAGDESTGWITVPVGYLLTECVYDITNGQQACGVRLALDITGDIAEQVEAALVACS